MEHLQPREYEASRLVLGDEIEALTQQLEEIRYYRENDKGKRRADDLPDSELSISASLDEVTTSLGILGDLKFAQCLAQEEFRAEEDRRLASRYSIDDPPLESFSEFDDDTGCDYSIFQRLCYSVNGWFMGSGARKRCWTFHDIHAATGSGNEKASGVRKELCLLHQFFSA
ncbi:hypothetical protein BDW71DRAFT_207092 [Aspergillus fruticulosus]